MKLEITFPGKKQVFATIDDGGMQIKTDQPLGNGGDGEFPDPFTYFLASLGTCAGIYVVGFCRNRDIPTDNITISEDVIAGKGPDGKPRIDEIRLTINLPADFPEKYRQAVTKVADQCKVKRTIEDPPRFVVESRIG